MEIPQTVSFCATRTTVTPDMAVTETSTLSAPVSAEASEGWKAYAAKCGASFVSVMDVIGRRLAQGEVVRTDDPTIAEMARERDFERRRRPK